MVNEKEILRLQHSVFTLDIHSNIMTNYNRLTHFIIYLIYFIFLLVKDIKIEKIYFNSS